MTVCMACSLRGWDFSYSERDSEISERRGPKDRAGPVHAVVKPRDLYRGHAKRVDRREGGRHLRKGTLLMKLAVMTSRWATSTC